MTSPSRTVRRRGTSMIEVLIVVSILAVVYTLTVPKLGDLRARNSVRAARQVMVSAFATARASALQKGKTATLTLTGSSASVSVLSGLNGTSVTVYGPVALDRDLGSTLSSLESAPMTVQFDGRGLVTPAPVSAAPYKYRIVNGVYADTLCISAAGIILPQGCQL